MKGIGKGPLTANGSINYDVSGFFAYHYAVYLADDPGGGVIAVTAGLVGNEAPLMLIDLATGLFLPYTMNANGLYPLDVCCESITFTLTGSTAPNLLLTLFPEPYR